MGKSGCTSFRAYSPGCCCWLAAACCCLIPLGSKSWKQTSTKKQKEYEIEKSTYPASGSKFTFSQGSSLGSKQLTFWSAMQHYYTVPTVVSSNGAMGTPTCQWDSSVCSCIGEWLGWVNGRLVLSAAAATKRECDLLGFCLAAVDWFLVFDIVWLEAADNFVINFLSRW